MTPRVTEHLDKTPPPYFIHRRHLSGRFEVLPLICCPTLTARKYDILVALSIWQLFSNFFHDGNIHRELSVHYNAIPPDTFTCST